MTRATTRHGITTFAYDALGRRNAKHSQAIAGTSLRELTRIVYCWDGDTLAMESSVHDSHAAAERTVHYVYERDSFVPLVQATRHRALQLAPTTDVKALMASNDGRYDIALDPLWNGEYEKEAESFVADEIAFYQCDQLGTPQELTDHEGKVGWSAQYKAWGEAHEAVSEAARRAGMRNPIRFQGQYFDDETGLHYNRHRYYDPAIVRYLTRDPIGILGGINTYAYAPNPVGWLDAFGLSGNSAQRRTSRRQSGKNDPCDEQRKDAKAAGWKTPDGSWIYPPNDGFYGPSNKETLGIGTKLDRYGGERGRFLAPNGASYEGRALPPGTDKLATYHQYEVTNPITVESGPATPWFDEIGMGTQYKTERSVEQLIASGCLRRSL